MAMAEEDSRPAVPRVAAADDSIAHWIAELDDSQYLVRERATQNLLAAGSAGLEPLLAAANGSRPEPADRAVWILRQLSQSADRDQRQGALERLVQIKNRPRVVAEASEALARIQHELAVRAIAELGGQYIQAGDDEVWGGPMPTRVVLGETWRGGDAGLAHVAQLRDVEMVVVLSRDVSAAGLAQLNSMQSLRKVQLLGTSLEDADVADLRQKFQGRDIDFRRGALLGVRGNDGQQAAEVGFVQAGSAAAAAGIRVQDVIRKFDGKAVANFAELTAEIAKHRPDDEVSLEVSRGGQTIEMTVKLGRWKSPEARPK